MVRLPQLKLCRQVSALLCQNGAANVGASARHFDTGKGEKLRVEKAGLHGGGVLEREGLANVSTYMLSYLYALQRGMGPGS